MTLAKRTRILYLLLSICSLICLICIGFSSWTIVSEVTKTAGGSLIASPVVDHSEYFESTQITCFEFSEESFSGSNSGLGYVTAEYKLNVTACEKLAGSDGSITITFYLRVIDANGSELVFNTNDDASNPNMAMKLSAVEINELNMGEWRPTSIQYSDDNKYCLISTTLLIADIITADTISIRYSISYVDVDYSNMTAEEKTIYDSSSTDSEKEEAIRKISYTRLYNLLVQNPDTDDETTAQFYCHGRVEKAS